MSLQVEKLENNMAKLTIEVPADDLEKALQSAYMKQKNKICGSDLCGTYHIKEPGGTGRQEGDLLSGRGR